METNTLSSAAQTRNGLNNWRTWPQSTTWQRLGTHLQKAWLGTKKTVMQLGQTESLLSTPAKSAASFFSPSRRQGCIFAAANALRRIGAKNTQTITPLKQRQSVYNLSVEGAHSYYANGILVHNCDALSYIDQLAVTSYFEEVDDDDWQPVDIIAGV
jgi:hypothetical protein